MPRLLFALKTVISSGDHDGGTIQEFLREVEVMNRFNGHRNPHFITILAAFTHKGSNYILLPFAESNLREYWRTHTAPLGSPDKVEIGEVRWLSEQILGIATALSIMHEERYRHGDIKPENIVWHDMGPESRGILVVADFGLVLRQSSASAKFTSMFTGFTPAYRPPECDMEDQRLVSGSLDIWSLGCVYLEMACWMLGGNEAVEAFAKARLLSTSLGTTADTFFEIQRTGPADPGSFRVKPPVVEVQLPKYPTAVNR